MLLLMASLIARTRSSRCGEVQPPARSHVRTWLRATDGDTQSAASVRSSGGGTEPFSQFPAGLPGILPNLGLDALVFDFDGLLMDTETTSLRVWQHLWRGHGPGLDVAAFFAPA